MSKQVAAAWTRRVQTDRPRGRPLLPFENKVMSNWDRVHPMKDAETHESHPGSIGRVPDGARPVRADPG